MAFATAAPTIHLRQRSDMDWFLCGVGIQRTHTWLITPKPAARAVMPAGTKLCTAGCMGDAWLKKEESPLSFG